MKSKKNPRRNYYAVGIAACLCLGTMYALSVNKMKVTAVCRDVRVYMDGAYSAQVLSGGLSPRTSIVLYRKDGSRQEKLGTLEVRSETKKDKGVTTVIYEGNNLKMAVANAMQPKVKGLPAHLEAVLKGEKISVNLGCLNPSRGS